MFGQVLFAELMKLHRAKVPWFTLGALMMGPLGLALFMWIVMEPGRAAQLGLLGTKADLSGLDATWPSYATFLTQIVGTGGMLLLAFIVAYVFGREYDDGTAKYILALPVARHWFVIAKLIVAAFWWFAIVAIMIAEGIAIGLPGFSAGLALETTANVLLAAAISYLLVPIVAWITVWGRGNMAPIGFAVGMLLLGNVFGNTGWAEWFPWSIVPLLVGSVGAPVQSLPTGSYVVVALTFLVGVAATALQLRYADNTQ